MVLYQAILSAFSIGFSAALNGCRLFRIIGTRFFLNY